MKENWLKMKEWWSSLAMREKRMLSVGGSVAVLFMLYQFIWSPSIGVVTDMRERIESQQKVLSWMQAADAEIAMKQTSNQPKGAKTSPIVLLTIMQKQITQAGLAQSLGLLKQASNDSIAIQFKKVDFDKMINLVIATLREQDVTLTQMSVNADTTPGLVTVNMMLKIS